MIKNRFLSISNVKDVHSLDEVLSAVLAGNTAILVSGATLGISASTAGGEKREVNEPQSETVIRGPREGFTENLRTNTALIRRKIRNPDLWIESRKIGRISQTEVAVM
ncbi:spore germination protein [Paenibacillus sp. JTLBN-2024]